MSEVYSELFTTFTTADTVGPVRMSFLGDRLEVEFAVFGSPIQRIVFHDVRAFAWVGWEGTSSTISPDRVYQVRGSSFLAPWERFAVGELSFAHFKLGFNAEGKYLDVVATRMEEKTPNQPPQPTSLTGRG